MQEDISVAIPLRQKAKHQHASLSHAAPANLTAIWSFSLPGSAAEFSWSSLAAYSSDSSTGRADSLIG